MPVRITPTLYTAPSVEPIAASDVKAWAKIDVSDDDTLITNTLIPAARQAAEKYLRRALITQTWELTIDMPYSSAGDYLPAGVYDMPVTALYGDLPREIDLPYKPIQSVTSVTTYDTSNNGSVYASGNYFLDTAGGRLVLNETAVWPSNLRHRATLVIRYVAGYGSAGSNVPQAIKTGLLMHCQAMYDKRVISDIIPEDALMQYNQYRVYA